MVAQATRRLTALPRRTPSIRSVNRPPPMFAPSRGAGPWVTRKKTSAWIGSGRCRHPGNHSTDGRKIEMPAFYRRHEAALAPQIWVGLSLTTAVLTDC